ncbi:hypothetical protein HC891_18010 [Candidatus Gracilibacteria bacterium]|nr:hypothetical protein [Candidatus Gracilibacteria bacterium]
MSYRDDYILRMIQQLGAIVRYALGLSLDGKDELALVAIDQAFRERLGTGVDTLTRHNSSQVLALVRFSASEHWREEAAFIAALLDAEAEIYGRRNSLDVAAERRLLALDLLLASRIDAEAPPPDFAPTVEELAEDAKRLSSASRHTRRAAALLRAARCLRTRRGYPVCADRRRARQPRTCRAWRRVLRTTQRARRSCAGTGWPHTGRSRTRPNRAARVGFVICASLKSLDTAVSGGVHFL